MNRSPYNLLQELYFPDVWKILVCCMLLNRVSRTQVDQVRFHLFKSWPDAEKMSKANWTDVERIVRPLGLGTKRAKSLIRMSDEFLHTDWVNPKELWGIGVYASDAYKMFVMRRKVDKPSDKFLKVYDKWWRTGQIDERAFAESRMFNTNI